MKAKICEIGSGAQEQTHIAGADDSCVCFSGLAARRFRYLARRPQQELLWAADKQNKVYGVPSRQKDGMSSLRFF